jgi:hypothetical protein
MLPAAPGVAALPSEQLRCPARPFGGVVLPWNLRHRTSVRGVFKWLRHRSSQNFSAAVASSLISAENFSPPRPDTDPKDCLMIGDSAHDDVGGAVLGMQCVITRPEQMWRALELASPR